MIRFTVLLPCHNCDRGQLRYALRSIVTQLDASVNQILVLDDQSTTPLEGLVREFPGVGCVRTSKELFGLETTNLGYTLADGDLIHVCHPDDATLNHYYAHVASAADQFPGRALYATSHLECDELGRPFSSPRIDWLGGDGHEFQPLHRGNPLAVAACCVSRKFVQEHGGWDARLKHVADWEFWLRATTKGGAVAINWPLAIYRHSASNHTGRLKRTADNLRDYLAMAEIVKAYMPVDDDEFRKYVAFRARIQEREYAAVGDREAAEANGRLAVELEAAMVKVVTTPPAVEPVPVPSLDA